MSGPPPPSHEKKKPTSLNPSELQHTPRLLLTPKKAKSQLVVLRDPDSYAAEQYRILAHRIERQQSIMPIKTVAITSALEGEGKTLTAINLALALAETRPKRIILVDLDLRRGDIANLLGLGEVAGLNDVLADNVPVSEVLHKVGKNLAVLPSGNPVEHPVSRFRSMTWYNLVESLRNNFDYVIFDCAPLCLTGDMSILEEVIDQTMIVVRSGFTRTEAIQEALQKLNPKKVLGYILNDVDETEGKYSNYRYKSESKDEDA